MIKFQLPPTTTIRWTDMPSSSCCGKAKGPSAYVISQYVVYDFSGRNPKPHFSHYSSKENMSHSFKVPFFNSVFKIYPCFPHLYTIRSMISSCEETALAKLSLLQDTQCAVGPRPFGQWSRSFPVAPCRSDRAIR